MTELNPAELKVQALSESFAQKTINYENQIADLRVQLTIISNENEELKKDRAAQESDVQEEEKTNPDK